MRLTVFLKLLFGQTDFALFGGNAGRLQNFDELIDGTLHGQAESMFESLKGLFDNCSVLFDAILVFRTGGGFFGIKCLHIVLDLVDLAEGFKQAE